jgi:hypothetical protein
MVQARLNGFLPSDFDAATMPLIDLANPPAQRRPPPDYGAIEIADGRALDPQLSEAQRFERNGFVILDHATEVGDWDADIARVYHPEIDTLVRDRLFAGVRVEVQQGPVVVRRGRDTSAPYAGGVHSDGPLTPGHYAENVAAFAGPQAEHWWKAQYDRPDARGFVQVDFWRPTNMHEPLRHMPLALCRPGSLAVADIVPTEMIGIAPDRRKSRHLVLRFNQAQQWFYFPEMRTDEVLAFKLGEFWKDDDAAAPQNVFHTAFELPDTPADAERRQSCEHRVGVLILRE